MRAHETTSSDPLAAPDADRTREILGIISTAATLLMALSLGSHDARGGENLIGPVGQAIASALASAFGVSAWLVPIETALATSRLFTGKKSELGPVTLASTLVIVFFGCALTHLALPSTLVYGGHLAGGVIGEVLGEVMRALLGLAGAFVIGIAILLVTMVLRTEISVFELVRNAADLARRIASRVAAFARAVLEAWREAKAIERAEREAREAALAPRIITSSGALAAPTGSGALLLSRGAFTPSTGPTATAPGTAADPAGRTGSARHGAPPDERDESEDDYDYDGARASGEYEADARAHDADPDGDGADVLDSLEAEHAEARLAWKVRPEPANAKANADDDLADDDLETDAYDDASDESLDHDEPLEPLEPDEPATHTHAARLPAPAVPAARSPEAPASVRPAPTGASAPKIVPVGVEPRRKLLADAAERAHTRGRFQLPPTTLLTPNTDTSVRIDETVLRETAKRLTEKLADYGVKGRVDEIHPGPVVTMYEFEPAAGTKINKISGLADDLAMALAAQKVRIVAPIPGKSRVGFELPNKHRKMVYLRDILEDEAWHEHKAALPIALGQDIAGRPVYYDLAKMPHLLVAGATGQGKSVGLNVMLTSLLAKKTPDELRMIMVDPKVVELKVFDGIPHMLLPVVTDMKKAALALKWAVDEMERRYQLFADAGAKNIVTFNERIDKVNGGTMTMAQLFPSRAGKVRAQGPGGETMFLPADDERSDALDTAPTRLPYVLVVIDEFADLMMVSAKDVEACVARLAQKARAAGIHVILATQRPSVDVITGMIKANFPARMAFKVSQREDSRTILGSQGAEHLLGLGDMLLLPPGSSDVKRVHSAYVSEEEVEAFCDHLRAQGKPVYDESILAARDDEEGAEGAGAGSSGADDPLYDRAVACVSQAGFCSISQIQRALGVGYNKAAKLVDEMEKQGVVGSASAKAGGRREVLTSRI